MYYFLFDNYNFINYFYLIFILSFKNKKKFFSTFLLISQKLYIKNHLTSLVIIKHIKKFTYFFSFETFFFLYKKYQLLMNFYLIFPNLANYLFLEY